MKHKFTNINIDRKDVDIDDRLVNVVKELNNVGLKTTHSCEGDVTLSEVSDDGKTKIENYRKAYISIEASPAVKFEFKENKLIIRWILIK